jgi:hypothetical protein
MAVLFSWGDPPGKCHVLGGDGALTLHRIEVPD